MIEILWQMAENGSKTLNFNRRSQEIFGRRRRRRKHLKSFYSKKNKINFFRRLLKQKKGEHHNKIKQKTRVN